MGKGLSRRDMIKSAAVAGAAAWTAPLIIDSLSAPAGAAVVDQCGVVKIASNSGISGGGFSQCDMAGNLDFTCLFSKTNLSATNYSPSSGIAVLIAAPAAAAIENNLSSIGSNFSSNCNATYSAGGGDTLYSSGPNPTCGRSSAPFGATFTSVANYADGTSAVPRFPYATLSGGASGCAAAGQNGFLFTVWPVNTSGAPITVNLGGGATITVCNGMRLVVFDATPNVNQVALQICFPIGSVPPQCSGQTFPTC